MGDELALLPERLTAHLQLSLAALAAGIALSVPAGIWVSRRKALEGVVLGAASVLQTIPSLALLAFMVPLFGLIGAFTAARLGVEISSIGFAPAWVALTLYSVLPILRNTVAGIAGVDPALIEAARGVGMTPGQRLVRVELPLALPVIVAGIRTSTVWVVGTATLATPVGATSLGNFIFSGLQTRNVGAVLIGSVAAALLALALDGLVRSIELSLRRRARASLAVSLAAVVLLGAWAGGSAAASAWRAASAPRALAIGSKTFTEQYILAALLAEQITRETGRATEAVESLGSTVAFDALRAGEIDVYVDYSGTIWATIMKRTELPRDRNAVVREVAEYLDREHGIALVASLGFENTYALGMRDSQADALGIERIGDLAPRAPQLEIGGDYEFFARPEWEALRTTYGLAFEAQRSMDSALMYQAVAEGDVDVISAFSTDGRIASYDLRLLQDDRGVIPPYDAIVLVSGRVVREEPGVVEALRALGGRIDASTMQRMNGAVDSAGESPAAVARAFLDAPDP